MNILTPKPDPVTPEWTAVVEAIAAQAVGTVFKYRGMQYEDAHYVLNENLPASVESVETIYVQPGHVLFTEHGHSTVLITSKTLAT